MDRDYLQEALLKFNIGKHQWYSWRKVDDDGNKIPNDQRMKYEHIILNDATATLPSEADVNAKIQELKDAEQSQYVEQRRNAYPPIGDQLDMLWHTIDKDILLQKRYFDFYQTIKKVKVKYPKT